uniref:Uncharacterized protein n=1 Tax=Anolis carolinensis TaxID=28377 RepID=A0A803U0C4_ANOCA
NKKRGARTGSVVNSWRGPGRLQFWLEKLQFWLKRWETEVFLFICHNSVRNGTTWPMSHHIALVHILCTFPVFLFCYL